MFKKKEAITLIALIITIIVLLILVGVTINMVLGENGLLNNSKTAVGKYENAKEKDNSVLNNAEEFINTYNRETQTISEDRINELIEEKISDINNKMEWKLLGSATGTTALNLPNTFNELYVEINQNNMVIPYATLLNTAKTFAMGQEYISGYNWGSLSKISVSKTKINMSYCYCFEGTKFYRDDTASTTMRIYYR